MFTRAKAKRQQLADGTRDAMDRAADSAAELEKYVRQGGIEAEEILRDSARKLRRRSSEAYEDVADIVHAYPVATIATACAVGALIVLLLKRPRSL